MSKRILVAGIGNIFFGDDAFGVETVRQLMGRPLPEQVRVFDFGIRSYDLAYALMDGYDAVIFVDATPRGHSPGTLYLIEPEIPALEEAETSVNAHDLDPLRVLQLARSMGGQIGRVYLAACEPEVLETEDGEISLSPQVAAAVPQAVELIETLIREVLDKSRNRETGFFPEETPPPSLLMSAKLH